MTSKLWLAGAAAAAILGATSMAVQAGPASSAATDLKAAAGQASAVEQVHWRRHRYYRSYYFAPPYRYYRHWGPRRDYGLYYRPWVGGYRHYHRHWW